VRRRHCQTGRDDTIGPISLKLCAGITLWVGRAQQLGDHSSLLIWTNRQAPFGTMSSRNLVCPGFSYSAGWTGIVIAVLFVSEICP
jgi:hypothetical protein